jgi:protein TonB
MPPPPEPPPPPPEPPPEPPLEELGLAALEGLAVTVVTPTDGAEDGDGAGLGDAKTVKDDTEAEGSGWAAETMVTEKGGSAGDGAEGAGAVTVTAD